MFHFLNVGVSQVSVARDLRCGGNFVLLMFCLKCHPILAVKNVENRLRLGKVILETLNSIFMRQCYLGLIYIFSEFCSLFLCVEIEVNNTVS